jgi:bacterioferritin-associated ferredoxin
MIICHCEVISDQAVEAAMDDGAHTLDQVCQMTGAGQSCGGCIFSLQQVLCQHDQVADQSRLEVA